MDAFCRASANPEKRLWLGALCGDWLTAEDAAAGRPEIAALTAEWAERCRALRRERLLQETGYPDWEMVRLYQYVGPAATKDRAAHAPPGVRIESVLDLRAWVRSTGQRPNPAGLIAITFVIDGDGFFKVADRASEHVACSGLMPVLSAGEMFLRLDPDGVVVEEVSNQSTGFCPEPASWPAVAAALDQLGVRHPGRFTLEVTFRRCPACGERNVVKDGWFTCGVCGADLPADWNF